MRLKKLVAIHNLQSIQRPISICSMARPERTGTTVTPQGTIVGQISLSLAEANWMHSDIRVKVVAFNVLINTLTYSIPGLKRVYPLCVLRHEQCMLADIGPNIHENGTLTLAERLS
jgi:hypothetical protein